MISVPMAREWVKILSSILDLHSRSQNTMEKRNTLGALAAPQIQIMGKVGITLSSTILRYLSGISKSSFYRLILKTARSLDAHSKTRVKLDRTPGAPQVVRHSEAGTLDLWRRRAVSAIQNARTWAIKACKLLAVATSDDPVEPEVTPADHAEDRSHPPRAGPTGETDPQ